MRMRRYESPVWTAAQTGTRLPSQNSPHFFRVCCALENSVMFFSVDGMRLLMIFLMLRSLGMLYCVLIQSLAVSKLIDLFLFEWA